MMKIKNVIAIIFWKFKVHFQNKAVIPLSLMAKKAKTRIVALVRLTSLHSTLIPRQQIVVSFCSQLTITPSGSSINIWSSMLEL